MQPTTQSHFLSAQILSPKWTDYQYTVTANSEEEATEILRNFITDEDNDLEDDFENIEFLGMDNREINEESGRTSITRNGLIPTELICDEVDKTLWHNAEIKQKVLSYHLNVEDSEGKVTCVKLYNKHPYELIENISDFLAKGFTIYSLIRIDTI